MYTPLTIANTIIMLNWKSRPAQNPIWLNKMVHIVHGWSLAFNRSVVSELPEVWQFGPIYVSLYDALRKFKRETVSNMQPLPQGRSCPVVPDTDIETLRLIEKVLERYGHLDHNQLCSYCHSSNSPWAQERNAQGHRVPAGHVIPEWRIENHYRNLIPDEQWSRAA